MLDVLGNEAAKYIEQEKAGSSSYMRDAKIRESLLEFDLLGLACEDAGEQRGYREAFGTCPICGHHDCFVVYDNGDDPESFYCYSTNGGLGGTAIDYLMHTLNMNVKEATSCVLDMTGIEQRKMPERISCDPDPVASKLRDMDIRIANINDKDLSRVFAKLYDNTICYVPEIKSFMFFNGRYWQRDCDGQHTRLACKRFIDLLISTLTSKDDDGKILKKLADYKAENRRSHLVRDIQSEMLRSLDDFDQNRFLLNALNVTIDLESGEVREHRASDMITKCAPVTYDPQARSELWEKVLSDCQFDDMDTIRYMQKVLGKSLMGDTTDEKLFILGFAERSGKGAMMGSVLNVLGVEETGYACSSQGDVFEKRARGNSSSARGNIAMMENKRLVVSHEPSKDMALDEAMVKQLTGNDHVTARKLYQEDRTFKPQATILIATNHMPRIGDRTILTSGRVVCIPFENRIPECDRDTELKEKLARPEEKSAILNWLIDGARLYREEGLEPSQRVREHTMGSIEKCDSVKRFLEERMVPASASRLRGTDVHDRYLSWAKEKNLVDVERQQFYAELEILGVRIKKNSDIKINGETKSSQRNVIMGYALVP